MKIKTAELTGKPLDWALAVADGRKPSFVFSEGKLHHIQSELIGGGGWHSSYDHSNSAICMRLIKEHVFGVESIGGVWCVFPHVGFASCGLTLEQAVARCVVAMRLGDEVSVPDELCGVSA